MNSPCHHGKDDDPVIVSVELPMRHADASSVGRKQAARAAGAADARVHVDAAVVGNGDVDG